MVRQVGGARALGVKRLLASACCFCRSSTSAVMRVRSLPSEASSPCKPLVFAGDLLAHGEQVGEIAGERIGLCAHIRKHRAEQMAVRTACSASSGCDQRRRRPVADALQRGQHFPDHGAAPVERLADTAFLARRAAEPCLRRRDAWLRPRGCARRYRSDPG